jgi:hypothetical protein
LTSPKYFSSKRPNARKGEKYFSDSSKFGEKNIFESAPKVSVADKI